MIWLFLLVFFNYIIFHYINILIFLIRFYAQVLVKSYIVSTTNNNNTLDIKNKNTTFILMRFKYVGLNIVNLKLSMNNMVL